MPHSIKKMSLMGLILMIFTSVFGFANSPSAYYLMGYSAIPFYIFSALLFFIPFALMMAEMGAAYRKEWIFDIIQVSILYWFLRCLLNVAQCSSVGTCYTRAEMKDGFMPHTIKKMSLIGLILMIFTSVFGFANSPSAYYLMGYSAIPFYIFSALLFFIPFALMMAEMGAAYRKEEGGGIYSWMNNSVGPRFAFIGTFMWFSSYIIWMVSTSAKVWVPFSTFLYGSDMTQHWRIAGLEPTQVVGLLAVAWMILVTVVASKKVWVPFSTFLYGSDMTQHWRIAGLEPTQVVGLLAVAWMILVTVVASKGINKIARITAVGGIAVMCLNLVLLNGGHFAQDINFLASPNPGYQSGLAMLSFVVFAIFAYGGIEAVGGLVDKTENPEKNFAKGIVFAAIVISIGYSLAIFLWGLFLPLLLFQSVIRWQYFYGASAQTGSRY